MGRMVWRLPKETKVWAPLALIVVVGVALSIYASVVSAGFDAAQTRAEFERRAGGEIAALKVSVGASMKRSIHSPHCTKPARLSGGMSSSDLPQ